MDRLTRRINGLVCYTKGKYEDTITAEMETRDVRECLEKLAEYEDIGSVEEIKEIVKKYSTHRENDMKTHEIKTLPEYFQQTLDGNKGFSEVTIFMENIKPSDETCVVCKKHKANEPFEIRDDKGILYKTSHICYCPYCGRYLQENYID